ncbi:heavy-metal-associated domain-containing protein [Propioniciclava sinopodophylli]|uniref:heavy-metal-associated domain-containing protein n=1 Tax=Propioniciclava sinopodophylli TaxID=1837344 RepID=UPI0024921D7F|nr:hypothetical protein [Propioniciclava sinopodophylli]
MTKQTTATRIDDAPAVEYGVRGLTCGLCVGAAMEELRLLPAVVEWGVELVPNGESTVTVASAGEASGGEVAAALVRAGFHPTGRRQAHSRRPARGAKRHQA